MLEFTGPPSRLFTSNSDIGIIEDAPAFPCETPVASMRGGGGTARACFVLADVSGRNIVL